MLPQAAHYLAVRGRATRALTFDALFSAIAKAQPLGGYLQPAGQRAKLVLRRNGLPLQPFARCMHRNGVSCKTHVELPGQLRRAAGRVLGVAQRLLQPFAEVQALLVSIHGADYCMYACNSQ